MKITISYLLCEYVNIHLLKYNVVLYLKTVLFLVPPLRRWNAKDSIGFDKVRFVFDL